MNCKTALGSREHTRVLGYNVLRPYKHDYALTEEVTRQQLDYGPRKHVFNTGNSRTSSSQFAKQYDVA
jgi:hypothetical protein